MVNLIFGRRIFKFFRFDQYFALDFSLSDWSEVRPVSDNLIIINDHIKFLDGNTILFCDKFLKAVNIGNIIDSEESLIIVLDVFDLVGFHLFDSDILLNIVDFLVPVDDFFKESNHFFDALKVIFLWVILSLFEDSLCEYLHKVNFNFLQYGTSWGVDLGESFGKDFRGFWIFRQSIGGVKFF